MHSAITFDFHNTLIRCDPWFNLEVADLPGMVADAMADAGEFALEPPRRELMAETYRGLRAEVIAHGNEIDAAGGVIETYFRMGYVVQRATIEPVIDDLVRPLVTQSEVVDGVRETLAHLAGLDIKVGVVSSAVHHDFLEWSLAYHDLLDYFTDVTTSASSGYYKSRPEIFLHACHRLGSAPERTIHVGDSFRFDHLGGTAAGLRTVWLNQTGSAGPDDGPRPDLELASLVGAGPLIEQLLTVANNAR